MFLNRNADHPSSRRRYPMNIHQKYLQVVSQLGQSKITPSPYDTAWTARLGEMDSPLSLQALQWISENQLADGTWGAAAPYYYHDRMICTLAAITTLAKHGRRNRDRKQIERGQSALESLTQFATKGLTADPAGVTIGFEMLMPTLLAEAESLGLISRQGEQRLLSRLSRQRAQKIASLPGRLINRHVTVAFSAEMAGADGLGLLDVEHLQEDNGCVAYSPAATVYFLLHVRHDDRALHWLHSVARDGALPYIAPIDTFEYAWALWNFSLANLVDSQAAVYYNQYLDILEQYWMPGQGIGSVAGFSLRDGDTSSLAFNTLVRYGRQADLSGILYYEGPEHFRCFPIESSPSISTNVHILGALRQAGFEAKHPTVQKVLSFLSRVQTRGMSGDFWFDKWHASPYYTTAHAIIECAGYDNERVLTAVEWILNTQNPDGSWGFYMPTAEETAYCLQALSLWKQHAQNIPAEILKKGARWLERHSDHPYPWLWIGKGLYCPELVVESAILSALALVEQTV
ncbi:MAG: cyclase [Anaerolineae bacterium]|nr:MAG: cyclase [Anaerolineae bacterium]